MTAELAAFPRPIGRGRQPASVERIRDLEMEVRAAGLEMCAMATRLTSALAIGDVHAAQHYAGRLWTLGHSYAEPEEAA